MSTKPNKPKCDCSDDFEFDPFDYGELLDEHMDVEIDDEKLAKRMQDAADMARRLGSTIAGGIEDDLDELTKPKLTWQDFTRFVKTKLQQGQSKNNWNSPRRRLLFSGLYVPTKINHSVKFLLAYDCSGSMSKEAITYGVSQVQALNENGEGFCIPWDSQPYFDAMVKIKSAKADQLRNAKYKGGGGTYLAPLFEQYEAHTGKVDIIIVVSDFFLGDEEMVMKLTKPKDTEVIWLSVAGNPRFVAPFGRLFKLMNE
jgi:predicted metal-dependent peptidase